MANNIAGLKALLVAGADLDLKTREGLTPRMMLTNAPAPLVAVTEAGRERDVVGTTCEACHKAGARMRCMRCRSVFYCDVTCQRSAWKRHKSQCADFSTTDYVDVDTKTMLTGELAPGLGPNVVLRSMLTGRSSVGELKPAADDPEKVFIVKVQRPFADDDMLTGSSRARAHGTGAVRVSNKQNKHLLVALRGPGSAAHTKLWKVVKDGTTSSLNKFKLYFAAKWLPAEGGGSPTVLRISTAKNLPAPKPLW